MAYISTTSLASTQSKQGLAVDATSLNSLKFKAGQDSKAALKETAKQFESLFMRELIKSMREATVKSGLMEEDQGGKMGTDMLDQQMAVQLSGLPGGLSQAIEKQLMQQIDPAAARKMGASKSVVVNPVAAANPVAKAIAPTASAEAFVHKHAQAAQQVAQESGIPASFMLGQAGHETGWGKGEIKHANGAPAFNLFGIKATGGWKGKVAEITTTEYVNGQPQKTVAKFRAYDSYEDSFRDYAKLIAKSPRYEGAMQNLQSPQAFASQLQKAGYATDPQYAQKLSKAINASLVAQRGRAA
jgi:flagellar protein FlgJ